MSKEHLQPNRVAPTLFVGVGGIGSKIVKKVAERSINDDVDAVRFVVMDTDVNDLERLERGVAITAVQTSSPRSVRDYLEDDARAKNDWFPVNNIISDKTVSEGAGQVRAISRLALNATIKNGNINKLYNAVDELFLKNGNDKNQAVKVVIVSTAAGGTGSGIAMVAGMLIRHYLKQKYPESAAVIRGFLLLPGVLDTVIPNRSERESLRRNGYATIKEINAFMMKGSGFFESERRLQRYKDLHVTIPASGGGYEDIDNLPFDFCFLLDRIDGVQRSMKGLDQYIDYAAHSLYEQNIGYMRSEASSKEDNVIKEFTDMEKLGRCRFGGVGASIVRYPYKEICEYIALDWTQKLLFGKVDDSLTDDQRDALIARTWLRYDAAYERERKAFENDMNASANDEPKLSTTYIREIENSEGDNFTDALFNKHIRPKVSQVMPIDSVTQLSTAANTMVDAYFDCLVQEALDGRVIPNLDGNGDFDRARNKNSTQFASRYSAIKSIDELSREETSIQGVVERFIKGVFESEAPVSQSGLGEYMLQRFLSRDGVPLHPNAVRYFLYKLDEKIKETAENNPEDSKFEENIENIINNTDKNVYKVAASLGQETSLEQMCLACDKVAEGVMGKIDDSLNNVRGKCTEHLNKYINRVVRHIENIIIRAICVCSQGYVRSLIEAYEKFYASFKDKAVSIDKKKEFIAKSLSFSKGDCVWNLFNNPRQLEMLSEQTKGVDSSSSADNKLFASIYNLVRDNAAIAKRNASNSYSDETPHDVFDECMIGYYRELVEVQKKDELDIDVLHAMKLEHKIKCDIEKKDASEESQKDAAAKLSKDYAAISDHIRKTLERGRNLATPGICKKSFDENRDVNAVAYSKYIKDGGGLRVSDYFTEKGATDTVSRYEVHFFRSIYVLMPTQIFQFIAPRVEKEDTAPRTHLNDSSDNSGAGESFLKYQEYMENIGPDSRMTPVITPHIDTRWNSISVMPEIDLDFQARLMKHIHKALFYGFLYDIITLHQPSKYDVKTTYRYRNGRDGFKQFIVSNKTRCDKLYEVLDSLYFDRAAVKNIHLQAADTRSVNEKDSVDFDKTRFEDALSRFSRTKLIGKVDVEGEDAANTERTSVFELPILYYNSLPPRLRDSSEIEIMVDAIIETIETEIVVFSRHSDAKPRLGLLIAEHYNLLYKNYKKFPILLGKEIEIDSNDVMLIIRKKVEDKLIELDVTMPKLGD